MTSEPGSGIKRMTSLEKFVQGWLDSTQCVWALLLNAITGEPTLLP